MENIPIDTFLVTVKMALRQLARWYMPIIALAPYGKA